jgi:predicted nucleic acid-binding protein
VSYLLDTNVISELVRRESEPMVIQWLAAVPDDALYLSVLTLGEVRRGSRATARRQASGSAANLAGTRSSERVRGAGVSDRSGRRRSLGQVALGRMRPNSERCRSGLLHLHDRTSTRTRYCVLELTRTMLPR